MWCANDPEEDKDEDADEAALRAPACCCTSFVPQSAQNLPGRPPTLHFWQYPVALAAEEEEEEVEEAADCGQVVRLWPLPPQLLHGMGLVVPQPLRSVAPVVGKSVV